MRWADAQTNVAHVIHFFIRFGIHHIAMRQNVTILPVRTGFVTTGLCSCPEPTRAKVWYDDRAVLINTQPEIISDREH